MSIEERARKLFIDHLGLNGPELTPNANFVDAVSGTFLGG